jgi:hypothetical protein
VTAPPELVEFNGDWKAYEDELHEIFLSELAKGGLVFEGLRVGCRRHEELRGRWASFWHLIQEGRVEDERTPDLRRCERIRWIRWVIENCGTHQHIEQWETKRGSEVNRLLWYNEEYLVVLAKRNGYWLLKTAYCTTRDGRIRKLRKERDQNKRR